MNKICPTCKSSFKTFPSQNRIHCSIKCYTRIGNKNPKWRGGFLINDGYRYIYNPNHPDATKMGYVLEHRLIMEKKIGRRLKREEAVHHLNHNRLDNREENLHLCPSNGKHFIDNHLLERNEKGQFKTVLKSLPSN